MGNLKNNIDHYMELKGIKMYSVKPQTLPI